jgi:DNA-binding MarR family transcriptional regulator
MQETLAAEYGISASAQSNAWSTAPNRPQAAVNRLTLDQRENLTHDFHTGRHTQHDLARRFGVSLSTVKRILRSHTTDE